MPYNANLLVSDVQEKLSYDPDTGTIMWLVSPAKNVMAGTEAGCVKATRTSNSGEQVQYRYIRIDGNNIPAARLAWVLHHGEWPTGRIMFYDKDPLNLKISNLYVSKSLPTKFDYSDPEQRKLYMRQHRAAHKEDWKNWHLQRKFGLSLHEYGQMLIAQNGKCAICGDEDGGTRNGETKALAVDHDHKTGKVRGLLCEACNQGIGKLKDDPKVLRAAADYLDKHTDPEGHPSVRPTN